MASRATTASTRGLTRGLTRRLASFPVHLLSNLMRTQDMVTVLRTIERCRDRELAHQIQQIGTQTEAATETRPSTMPPRDPVER